MRPLLAAAMALPLLADPAFAETIAGRASVIDGDTLEIKGERIRLHGIDAPESAQLCQDAAGKEWRCGQKAANALADRIGNRRVSCRVTDTDRYGRSVAACSASGESLNAWLVSQGWAVAYRRYSLEFVGDEDAARSARAGIWAGKFQPPWEWRKDRRGAAASKGVP